MPSSLSIQEDRPEKNDQRHARAKPVAHGVPPVLTLALERLPRTRSRVLRAQIDALTMVEAQERVLRWARRRESRYVVCANAHVVVAASADPDYGWAIDGADLTTPDGAPVAWMLRRLGHAAQARLSGPDLMWTLLERCAWDGVAVYFYGAGTETLRRLLARATAEFPTLSVAGAESPPFRPPTLEEDDEVVQRINRSGAALVFVGLGCPKQECWMAQHRGRVQAVMLGVGAAFDFHAGTVSRAPAWMRDHGLEWLHRLASEPGRLWKRYLLTNSAFMFGATRQLLARQFLGE